MFSASIYETKQTAPLASTALSWYRTFPRAELVAQSRLFRSDAKIVERHIRQQITDCKILVRALWKKGRAGPEIYKAPENNMFCEYVPPPLGACWNFLLGFRQFIIWRQVVRQNTQHSAVLTRVAESEVKHPTPHLSKISDPDFLTYHEGNEIWLWKSMEVLVHSKKSLIQQKFQKIVPFQQEFPI